MKPLPIIVQRERPLVDGNSFKEGDIVKWDNQEMIVNNTRWGVDDLHDSVNYQLVDLINPLTKNVIGVSLNNENIEFVRDENGNRDLRVEVYKMMNQWIEHGVYKINANSFDDAEKLKHEFDLIYGWSWPKNEILLVVEDFRREVDSQVEKDLIGRDLKAKDWMQYIRESVSSGANVHSKEVLASVRRFYPSASGYKDREILNYFTDQQANSVANKIDKSINEEVDEKRLEVYKILLDIGPAVIGWSVANCKKYLIDHVRILPPEILEEELIRYVRDFKIEKLNESIQKIQKESEELIEQTRSYNHDDIDKALDKLSILWFNGPDQDIVQFLRKELNIPHQVTFQTIVNSINYYKKHKREGLAK